MPAERGKRLLALAPLALFLPAWQLATGRDEKRQFLFSSPLQILRKAGHEYVHAEFWQDAGITALETVLGLACGTMLGIAVGLLMWHSERFGRVARPYIVVLGAVPVFAIAPMLIIWFGIGLMAKVVMAAFGVFLTASVQSFEGATAAAREHLFFARSLGASRRDILYKIIIPGSLRWIMTGFRLNIGMALLGAFIGEFVNSDAGLGHYILRAGSLYDMAGVMFGIINLSALALALLLGGLATLAEFRWFPWALPRRI